MTARGWLSGHRPFRIVVAADSAEVDVIKEACWSDQRAHEEWLQGVGLRRSDVYITTIVTDRAVKRQSEDEAEGRGGVWSNCCTSGWRSSPTVGDRADGRGGPTALTGKREAVAYGGAAFCSTWDARGRAIKVIPTIHPQETFRAATLERWCRGTTGRGSPVTASSGSWVAVRAAPRTLADVA